MIELLPQLLEASIAGGVFLLIYLALRPALRRMLGPAVLSVFWAVILLRFIVLWPLQTSWGAATPWAAKKESPVPWTTMVTWGDSAAPARTSPNEHPASRPAAASGIPWVPVIWAAGALFCLALQVRNAWRLRRYMRSARVVTEGPVWEILRSFPEGWTRGLTVRLTGPGSSPMLAGLLRPCICLPEDWMARLNRSELRHLLMHEVGHVRRGDLFLQAMMGVVQCVHWFNPLVWIAPRYLRLDLEFGCDGWVLQRSEDEAQREYGATLIKTSQWVKASTPAFQASMGMAAGRRTLFARINGVSRFRSPAWWQTAFGTAMAMGAAFLLLTSQTSAEMKSEQAPPAENATQFSVPPPTPVDGRVPLVEVESKFLEMPESVWKSLGWNNEDGAQTSILTAEQRLKLLASLSTVKGIDVLSTPKVTTRAGQRAMIQIVREFRYATEWEPNPKHSGRMVPTAWETKPLGVTLEVEPTVSADGTTIDLEISPRVSELTGFVRQSGQPFTWKRDGLYDNLNPPADLFPKDEMVQPIFSNREITTNVVLRHDQAVLLGGLKKQGSPEEKDGLLLFILVQANTLQPGKDKAASTQTSSPQ